MADVPIRFVVLLLFGFILAIGWTVPTTGALERVEEESMLRDSALAAEIEACYRVQDAQYEW
ncbi:MAG: hypothetical protein GTN93_06835, partial [Anaerolineae bacterium]|nr:hypothetical protein [Anaerolineae bacterium]